MSFAQPFADYVILSRIGAGAMGTVFKARHKKLNRIVALKVLRPSLGRDTRYVERLRREARIVASLNHPNIVAGYDLGEEGGYHFFVMEYFEGPSLRTLLSEWGMFPEEQVLDLAIQVVKALDHAYRRGVIHRDIKPGNILIDAEGKVKLTDMGLAKGPTDLTLTRDGATVGTPQYISPEQARNPQGVDIRSDLYSLGATLYHMATGQTPFAGDTMAEVITKLLHERPASTTDLNPKLTDGLSLVIRKLMAKDPGLRYQTPRELLDDLLRVQRAETPEVDVLSLEAAEPPDRAVRRWRRVAAIAALPFVVGISIWIGTVASGGSDDGPPSLAEFSRRLESDLQAEATYRDQLELLARRAGSADEAQAREVAAARRRVLSQLERAMNEVVREKLESSKLAEWVANPAHFRDPEAWVREAREELETRLGFAELPDGASPRNLEAARTRLATLIRDREADWLADFDAYLATEIEPAYRTRLMARDYRGAAASLEETSTAFFLSPGRPTREQLPDRLREQAVQTLAAAGQVIEAEQTQAAESLERFASRTLEAIEEELRGADRLSRFRLLREQVGDLEKDLRARYPPSDHFYIGRDPWPRVEERIGNALGQVARAEQAAQSEHLDGLLSLTYQTLVEQGDFRSAWQWLDSMEEVSGAALEDRLNRHRMILAAGQAVAHAVLGTLFEASEALVVRSRLDPNRELTLVVEQGREGQFRARAVNPSGAEIAGSIVDLRFSDLLAQALARAPDLLAEVPHAQAGVALCLFISGESNEVVGYLSDEDLTFFSRQIWPILERVFDKRDQAISRQEGQALDDLRNAWSRARQGGSVGRLRRIYDEFAHRFPGVAVDNARVVGEIEAWLRHAEKRLDVAERVRVAGAEVDVDEGLRATVTYTPASFSAMQLPDGWSAEQGAVKFQLVDLPLSRAHEAQLGFAGLPLSEDRGIRLAVQLSFPPEAGSPRLWLFECDGARVALGLLADNAVVPLILGPDEHRSADALREALQAPLVTAAGLREPPAGTSPLSIVPGAIHELIVRVSPGPSANRLDIEVLLDGRLIAEGRQRPAARGRAAIIPMQPLAVLQVQLSGDFHQ